MWSAVALLLGLGWLALWLRSWDRVPHATQIRINHVPVYMRAASQGYVPHYNVTGRRGAVACEVDVCSNVGAYMLEKGGSAADAVCAMVLTQIIAASSCVGVISAFHSGIGGGGFALVKTQGNDPVMLDYRETAPGAAHRDMFVGRPIEASLFGCVCAD